jgi:1,4-dihydroxy-2-naphthoate octaprenyltransferase
MEKFFRDFPMAYQFVIELAVVIVGAALALPGQKKWGWIVFILGFVAMFLTMKYKGLFNI